MVTRSHLQVVRPGAQAPGASRARLLAGVSAQRELIERALDFVEPLYEGRTLQTGQPALTHALDVAQTLSELKLDPDALTAALLYPAYDMSADMGDTIREKFGVSIAGLTEGVVRMAQIGALTRRGAAASRLQQQA
ncbi:MAG: HD domain-containing protein, partial [Burkholderiales bacterium]